MNNYPSGCDPDIWRECWNLLAQKILERAVRDRDVGWLTSDECLNVYLPGLRPPMNEEAFLEQVDALWLRAFFT